MAHTFKGGIHPNDMKAATCGKAIELLPAPARVVIPMSMHIGAPCSPIVNVGDHVYLGQKIAEAQAPVSSPVHASVSGTVVEIAPKPHSYGSDILSIVIENDFKDEVDPSIKPLDIDTMTSEEIVEAVRQAGIVGHGGATFPTHIKISSGLGKVDNVLINCAECEPYITSDHRILLEYPWEVVGGAKILQKVFGVKEVKLGIELNKQDTFDGLKQYLPEDGSVKIYPLVTKYPQGSEKHLILALTGREVPSGKLPADAGCAVFNTDTCAAIYRLFNTGMPVIRRIVTVTGSAVANPKNLEARIGTPVSALFEAAGGFNDSPKKMVMGGPMMGMAIYSLEVPVIKGSNGLLAFCKDEGDVSNATKCIRCGKCVDACPVRLMPTYLYQASQKGTVADMEEFNALDCIECGSCSFVCPAKLPLVQGIRCAKQLVMEERKKKK